MDDARGESAVVSQNTVICGVHGLAPLNAEGSDSAGVGRVVPLPHLLRMHAASGDSGVLTIDRGTSIRSVFYQDGAIVWAEHVGLAHDEPAHLAPVPARSDRSF